MSKKLTAKQDKFARLVAEGKTQADAYRLAYNSAKMKSETVQNSAYKLMQNGDVTARVDELKKEFTKKLDIVSTITVERQIKYTQIAIKKCLELGDFNNYLKAMDMQNKLIGLYAPTKTDNTNTNKEEIDHEYTEAVKNLTKAIKSKK
jgi:hypothetical protein